MPTTLKISEHQTLRVGADGLTAGHLDALALFNERNDHRYFEVGHRSLRAKQYVGVIQVGGVTLEIIPKTDRGTEIDRWRNALVRMLAVCGHLKVDAPHETDLLVRRRLNLLDLFLFAFLSEVEELLRQGLAKRYVRTEDEVPYLKGRIVFGRQIRTQMVRKHSFVTSHEQYLCDHLIHRVLKAALVVVRDTASTPDMKGKAQALLYPFEGVQGIRVTSRTFSRIVYSRKTKGYRRAVQLAELILTHYSPDVRSGTMPLLAILFDMNRLFEQYVAFLLRRAAQSAQGISITTQSGRLFWGSRRIVPDVVVRWHGASASPTIIDTKWKMVESGRPSDEDLRQMFTYNVHYGAARSILVYPDCGAARHEPTSFRRSAACPEFDHTCQTWFLNLFNEDDQLDLRAGEAVLKEVTQPQRGGQ